MGVIITALSKINYAHDATTYMRTCTHTYVRIYIGGTDNDKTANDLGPHCERYDAEQRGSKIIEV